MHFFLMTAKYLLSNIVSTGWLDKAAKTANTAKIFSTIAGNGFLALDQHCTKIYENSIKCLILAGSLGISEVMYFKVSIK